MAQTWLKFDKVVQPYRQSISQQVENFCVFLMEVRHVNSLSSYKMHYMHTRVSSEATKNELVNITLLLLLFFCGPTI